MKAIKRYLKSVEYVDIEMEHGEYVLYTDHIKQRAKDKELISKVRVWRNNELMVIVRRYMRFRGAPHKDELLLKELSQSLKQILEGKGV